MLATGGISNGYCCGGPRRAGAMNRLDEILSKTSVASPEGALPTPSAIAEAPMTEGAPVCPLCGGGGFVRRERPVDHPRFGKAEPCDCVLDEAEDVRR